MSEDREWTVPKKALVKFYTLKDKADIGSSVDKLNFWNFVYALFPDLPEDEVLEASGTFTRPVLKIKKKCSATE